VPNQPDDLVLNLEKADEVVTGEVLAAVSKATPGVSNNDNFKIDLHLKVLEAEEPSYVGRMIFDTITFTLKTAFQVKRAIKGFGLGMPPEFRVNETNVAALAAQLAQADPVWLYCIEEKGKGEYEGQDKSRVRRYGIRKPSWAD
jgi:hypothetical protein